MIEKRFIRVWLGHKKMPPIFEIWWKDFQKLHPDFEFLTIGNSNYKNFLHKDLENVFSNCPTYSAQSDVLRISSLYKLGGVYIDTDVMPLKNFTPLLNSDQPFLAKRSSKSFEVAVFGSPKEHPAILCLIKNLPTWFEANKKKSSSVSTGPAFVSNFIFNRPDVTKLPTTFFYPYNGFMAPKKAEKIKMFTKKNFPEEMYAAHFSNFQWGGKPNL